MTKLVAGLIAGVLVGCGGGSSGSALVVHTVGGSVTGLAVQGLVLTNGIESLSPLPGATQFQFPTAHAEGTPYNVAVQAQPAGITCSVQGGSGTFGSADVSSVRETFVPASPDNIRLHTLPRNRLKCRRTAPATFDSPGPPGLSSAQPVAPANA